MVSTVDDVDKVDIKCCDVDLDNSEDILPVVLSI